RSRAIDPRLASAAGPMTRALVTRCATALPTDNRATATLFPRDAAPAPVITTTAIPAAITPNGIPTRTSEMRRVPPAAGVRKHLRIEVNRRNAPTCPPKNEPGPPPYDHLTGPGGYIFPRPRPL